MITLRGMRRVAAVVLLAGAAACNAYIQPGSDQTGTPPMLVVGAGPPPAPGLAGPPANLDTDIVGEMPALGGSRSGIYSGLITPLDTAGGDCTTSQTVDGFLVSGNTVRWQQFRGQIVDGGLQMRHGNEWVIGAFENGNHFSGQVGASGPYQPAGCTWRIRLSKTGT